MKIFAATDSAITGRRLGFALHWRFSNCPKPATDMLAICATQPNGLHPFEARHLRRSATQQLRSSTAFLKMEFTM
jgi:hypothetical protein